MNVQHGIKIGAAALFASFVVFAPARAAIQQTPTQDTPTQVFQDTPTPVVVIQDTPQTPVVVIQDTPQTPVVVIQDTQTPVDPSHDLHEAEEALQRAADHAAHEAAEDAERAAHAAHEAEEELQRAAEHAAHEAAEEQERAVNSVHEAEEERQRAIAKAAHEAEEDLQRAARAVEKDLEHQPAQEVTMIGCVIREREYRKVHHDGKGGAFGLGIGGGNEYILVNAIRMPSRAVVPAGQPCDPTVGGQAIELTGKGESSMLRPYLGHWVELTGKLKRAEITKATRGTANPQPTGGKGPFWQDLKIFEINVYAVKQYVPPVVAVIPLKIEERAAVIETPQPEAPETPEPVATAGREELPKTASSMPLVALLGAFFLVAAIVLRALRGMTGRVGM